MGRKLPALMFPAACSALWLLALLAGCVARAGLSGGPSADPVRQALLDSTLVVIGRFSTAHGCPVAAPVGEVVLLTSAHVVDPRPFDQGVPLYPLRWSQKGGAEGEASGAWLDPHSDLAVLKLTRGMPAAPLRLAGAAPALGSTVWTLGYRMDSIRSAFAPWPVRATVVRTLAGHLVMSEDAGPGSSGACVLDERGEIVAVDARSYPLRGPGGVWDFTGRGTAPMAVGVWGGWAPKPLRPARPLRVEEQ